MFVDRILYKPPAASPPVDLHFLFNLQSNTVELSSLIIPIGLPYIHPSILPSIHPASAVFQLVNWILRPLTIKRILKFHRFIRLLLQKNLSHSEITTTTDRPSTSQQQPALHSFILSSFHSFILQSALCPFNLSKRFVSFCRDSLHLPLSLSFIPSSAWQVHRMQNIHRGKKEV